jgi:hypothetical protein
MFTPPLYDHGQALEMIVALFPDLANDPLLASIPPNACQDHANDATMDTDTRSQVYPAGEGMDEAIGTADLCLPPAVAAPVAASTGPPLASVAPASPLPEALLHIAASSSLTSLKRTGSDTLVQ